MKIKRKRNSTKGINLEMNFVVMFILFFVNIGVKGHTNRANKADPLMKKNKPFLDLLFINYFSPVLQNEFAQSNVLFCKHTIACNSRNRNPLMNQVTYLRIINITD